MATAKLEPVREMHCMSMNANPRRPCLYHVKINVNLMRPCTTPLVGIPLMKLKFSSIDQPELVAYLALLGLRSGCPEGLEVEEVIEHGAAVRVLFHAHKLTAARLCARPPPSSSMASTSPWSWPA